MSNHDAVPEGWRFWWRIATGFVSIFVFLSTLSGLFFAPVLTGISLLIPVLLFWLAKRAHGDELSINAVLTKRLGQMHPWLWLVAVQLSLAAVFITVWEDGDMKNGAISLSVLLLLTLPVAWLFQRKPMSDYLRLIGGGGVDEVKTKFSAAPAVAKLKVPANLAELVKAEVVGQDEALDELCAAIIRRSMIRRPNKPIFVSMLVGATGAGKTETAKAIAKALNVELTRFDMNEFTQAESAQRLTGSPPGYIGSEKGGQLTQAIKLRGCGVLLFDELEKAHENVMKMLMGLLDEGRITEQSSGETMDASSFIIIATSNAEYERIAEIAENNEAGETRNQLIKSALLKVWQPDKLSRFDAILAYKKLNLDAQIALLVRYLMKFAKEAGVTIVDGGLQPDALVNALHISQQTSTFGAREFQRALEREVMDSMFELSNRGVKRIRIGVTPGGRIQAFDAAEGVMRG